MPPSDVIETTVAEVTAELLRQGVGPDEAVSIIIEWVEGLAPRAAKITGARGRRRSYRCGYRPTDQAGAGRSRAEPGRGQAIWRRFALLGGVDLEPPSHGTVDATPPFDPSSS
jgi:hypothetical protein